MCDSNSIYNFLYIDESYTITNKHSSQIRDSYTHANFTRSLSFRYLSMNVVAP